VFDCVRDPDAFGFYRVVMGIYKKMVQYRPSRSDLLRYEHPL
jgi:hypothetical protein